MRLATVLAALTAGAAVPQARALPTTSVVVENLVDLEESPASVLLDHDGTTPLTAGTPANGDGAVLSLGYFRDPITSSAFSGTWVPLTGPAAANTGLRATTVGDTDSGAAGAYGFVNTQIDFDQGNPATFQDIPSAGTRLALAIYNGTTLASSTHFNIATSEAWRWKDPTLLPDYIVVDLDAPGTLWFDGPASARRTTVLLAEFPAPVPAGRLVNISTRGFVGTGSALMIPGFIIKGTGTKRALIRAVGPTLADDPFHVPGTLADPILRLVRQDNGVEIAKNDNWSDQPDADAVAAAIAQAWAFGIPEGSLDAALVVDLEATPSGTGYTPQVTGAAGGTGVVIAEVYLLDDDNPQARAVNISTRGFVGTGGEIMIPGFIVGPGSSRRFLVRAASTILAEHGLEGVLHDPVIRVYQPGVAGPIATNDNWEDDGQGPAISAALEAIGTFGLAAGSHDAALILDTRGDRSFTVQVAGADGGTGIVLTEIYELP